MEDDIPITPLHSHNAKFSIVPPLPVYATENAPSPTPLLTHPPPPIRRLLHRENLPRILLNPPPPRPQRPRLLHHRPPSIIPRPPDLSAKIRRLEPAEDELEGTQLGDVAVGDAHGDFDAGGVAVGDGAAEGAGEESADAGWGEEFEG